jgi:hypothetical protein
MIGFNDIVADIWKAARTQLLKLVSEFCGRDCWQRLLWAYKLPTAVLGCLWTCNYLHIYICIPDDHEWYFIDCSRCSQIGRDWCIYISHGNGDIRAEAYRQVVHTACYLKKILKKPSIGVHPREMGACRAHVWMPTLQLPTGLSSPRFVILK